MLPLNHKRVTTHELLVPPIFNVTKKCQLKDADINKDRSLFFCRFRPLLNQEVFFEAAGAVLKIGSSQTKPPLGN